MAEFKLGRIRFVWKSDWATGTTYYKDDVVQYGGKVFICIAGHTASAGFYTDLDAVPSKWNQMSDGFAWENDWAPGTAYKTNDMVKYGGRLYICRIPHTSAATLALGLEADLNLADSTLSKWDNVADGSDWKGDWTISTRYKVNDLVKYGGISYICNTYHTSAVSLALGLEADLNKWDVFNRGIEYKTAWTTITRYKVNDVVKFGSTLYICTLFHTSSASFDLDTAYWSAFVEGLQFENTWSSATQYQPGDIVRYGGYQYVAKTTHINSTPSTGTSDWDLFSKGFSFTAEWSSATSYKVGEVVSLGGQTYLCTTDHSNQSPPNVSYWDKLSSGVNWRNYWANSTPYYVGDVVRYGSNAYICITKHTSNDDDSTTFADSTRSPSGDTEGVYWNIFNVGSEYSVMTDAGDMVYYNGNQGPARLPIGKEGMVLKVSADSKPMWDYLGVVDYTFYVAPHGQDLPAPTWGLTQDKPWKTIRYACMQIEDGARNPNAQYLLEMNRVFIQREVSEWIQYQIANNRSPFTSSFVYDEFKCERDVGFVIDRLIWDIGHGGNLKTLAAALSYINLLSGADLYATAFDENGTGTYSKLAAQSTQDVASYNYMLTVIQSVLNNTAVAASYQTINGDNSTAILGQYFNTDLVAETGVYTTITSLVGIITKALTEQVATDLPDRYVPNNILNVKSGAWTEVLPIPVPAETSIVGDETRAVEVSADTGSVDITDSYATYTTFGRIGTVMGQIVAGTSVTRTTGNTATQSLYWPYASSAETTKINSLVDVMKYQADHRLGQMDAATMTDPTGYNTSYLIGYGDARKLIKENRKFLQEEVIAYLAANYPNSKYGKTKTRRDAGYIIDAMIYSLTYGGNSLSVQAGLAYFDAEGSTNLIPASIKELTLASITFLKARMQSVATSSAVTPLQTAIPQFFDTAGSAAASTLIGTNVDIIYNLINGASTTAAPNITVTTITGTTTLATASAHGLNVGDTFVPRSTANGLTTGTKYYVVSVPLATTFTLAVSHNGAAITTLTNGTGLTIVGDVVDLPAATNAVTTTTALITAYTTLTAQIPTIGTGAVTTVNTAYPTLSYSTTKTARDVAFVLEAVGYDFMFNSNYRTVKAAQAYLRANSVELYTTTNLKAATRLALTYAKTQAKASVGGDATAQARIETLMTLVDSVIFGAANEGDMCQSVYDDIYYANLQLERNRAFIAAEASAYIANTFKSAATATTVTTDVITVADTSWMRRNLAIEFTGTIPSGAGISTGVTYYVQNVVSSTTFTVATTRFASTANRVTLATKSGSWTVKMVYNSALCLRDVGYYIDAVKWDLVWSSNYKSRYVARYYANAVLGSQEEDFFYLRNGTGVKNMSLRGLNGQLTPENAYGTSRTTAGAYCSLDPGWGPADFRTWITSRSPYIQNNATFGNAAIGQKIDGVLHNGGNKSMVSNDFTQLISDGIGAWITNNGRAELVSVFTYYSHIGYLAEAGGRIRGTNGNNSYGDFGSVAEGYDVTETAKTAIVDNKFQYKAVVGSITTDSSAIFAFEFDHAGNEYTEATYLVIGPGNFADVEQDEFRDDAVYQVRLIDNVDDSTAAPEADGNQGGSGYLTKNGTAQNGTLTSITLSAVDDQLSSAYIGMKIVITAGNGLGQYALINAYNSGTKIADVITEATGAAGWDHFVAGTPIQAPDSSSSYSIEPAVSFTAPTYSSTASTLPTSGTWSVVKYGDTSASYSSLTGTYSGSGVNARFTVVRNGSKYASITIDTAGTGYARLETITILGTSLGGTTPANDLVITITSISTLGAIQAFDTSGYGLGGRFVALRSGSVIGATSEDGITWTTRTSLMPSGASWSAAAWGYFNDGSSLPGESSSRFVAVAGGSANTTGAYSADGITWTATSMNTSATWTDVCFGEGRFVAIASDSTTVRISGDGENWDSTGTLARTGYTCIAYGLGLYVAARSGSTIGAWSTDGVTWIEIAMPSASSWGHIAFGNGRFVALSQSSGTALAYSITGKVWYAAALPVSTSWTHITYGQGVFLAVTNSTTAATSQDGINWTSRTMSTAASGFTKASFGNPQRSGKFVAVGGGTGTVASYTYAGAKTRARAFVSSEKITAIRILEPGSGYASAPTITITDPNNIFEAPTTVRIGDGVLAMPSLKNRGTGYQTCSAEIDKGDGYADFFQDGAYVAVRRISARPAPGSNLVFAGKDITYKVVSVVSFRGDYDGSYTAFLQISPTIKVYDNLADGTAVTARIRYSQVRLTGHDFLDIGTGGFAETNYPYTPSQAPIQANETVEGNSGRVFYTSTDQDGNFRVGALFTIEQSTGVATLNADAFNLSGLQEISLGNLTLGGASARVQEFSTDPFFTQNSDSVIPTQRAIKAYIASQIGGGGASLIVNSVTAGDILIGTNTVTNVTGGSIIMGSVVNFTGGVTGYPLAISYFLN
jgi:hypothetical protein